jgi:hypothetical protein
MRHSCCAAMVAEAFAFSAGLRGDTRVGERRDAAEVLSRAVRYPARHGIPRGTVSRAARYPRDTVSRAARYPAQHGIPRSTMSRAARYPGDTVSRAARYPARQRYVAPQDGQRRRQRRELVPVGVGAPLPVRAGRAGIRESPHQFRRPVRRPRRRRMEGDHHADAARCSQSVAAACGPRPWPLTLGAC